MDFKTNFWEVTYQRNIKKMIGICFRYVSDHQMAEDLAHDAFLNAMHKAGTFKGKGHFDSWLRRITVNTALMHLRDIKRVNDYQQDLSLQDQNENDEDNRMRQDFSINELLETINKLPKHHMIVFNLYVIDKYSHKQIATELNISIGTSKSHLARARKKLQQLLTQKEEKSRSSFMLFFFPIGFGKIDRIYKKKFFSYEIETQNSGFLSNLDYVDIKEPAFRLFYNFKFAPIAGGLSIIIISTVLFNIQNKKNSLKVKSLMIPQDTLIHHEEIDKVNIITDSIAEQKNLDKNPPVVVKKKRLIRKTVIIQDTLTIMDTNHAE